MKKIKKLALGLLGFLLLSFLTACIAFQKEESGSALPTSELQPTILTATVQREIATIQPTTEQVSLLDEIMHLDETWHENYAKAGWVRVRYHEIDGYDNGMGQQEYFLDSWILLDDNGYQVSAIHLMEDLSGNPFQVSVMQDNMWRNLTYNTTSPVSREVLPLAFEIDYGFIAEATRLSDLIVKEELEIDSKLVFVYTITEKLASPMKFSDYNELVSAFIKRAYYDPETGTLSRYDFILVSPMGTSYLYETAQLVNLEVGTEPPSEILKYLEQP